VIQFEQDVKEAIETVKQDALDQIDQAAVDAVNTVIKGLLGARWDRWSNHWEFDRSYVQHEAPILLNAVEARARDIAPLIIEEALREPITFTKADIAKLRTLLREKILDAAGDMLDARAHEIAAEMLGQVKS
jgi:hypothetical protein